jgi:D-proline reductase (dithiol) PrdB
MNFTRIKNRMIARAITLFPGLAKRLIESYAPWESEDIPWTPFDKPLAECTVAVVTTAGVHDRDQAPFDMIDKDGDPSYRIIDLSLPHSSLMITHDYYDHHGADQDLNIVFPLDRLREFAREGIIGRLADRHYGFMGHITGPHIPTLMTRTARDNVDVAVLTPG